MKKFSTVSFRLTTDERTWVRHAARLNHITEREFIVRAINERLRQQGVDAVLLYERGWLRDGSVEA